MSDTRLVKVLKIASDMLALAMNLQTFSDDDIRAALRLLNQSNPRIVHWVLYALADIYAGHS